MMTSVLLYASIAFGSCSIPHSIAGDDIFRCFSNLSTSASGAVSVLRRKSSPKLEAVSLYRHTAYHREEKRCSLVSISTFLAASSDTWSKVLYGIVQVMVWWKIGWKIEFSLLAIHVLLNLSIRNYSVFVYRVLSIGKDRM